MTKVPTFAMLIGGDNRPVVLPMWMAQEILNILEDHNNSVPKSKTPCFGAEVADRVDDLRKLIKHVEQVK